MREIFVDYEHSMRDFSYKACTYWGQIPAKCTFLVQFGNPMKRTIAFCMYMNV